MGTVYAFFADGFEEIEAFTAVDTETCWTECANCICHSG